MSKIDPEKIAPVIGQVRLRRNRKASWSRRLVAENHLAPSDLIWPIFVTSGQNVKDPVASMPGVFRYSVDAVPSLVDQAVELGIPVIAFFPNTPDDRKTSDGNEALNSENLICAATRAAKAHNDKIGVMTDVALDPYTSHGHDGILCEGKILNDETVAVLAEAAVLQARAGADIIAPSDMMDGRIGVIRTALDQNGFQDVQIISYAAKYASAFYGPFRDAVGTSAVLAGDKKTYQMDPANTDEALREIEIDIQEGADLIMIKPGMPYLDIIRRSKDAFAVPLCAYQVSGEYAMIKAAASNGWLDERAVILESLMAFKRAGCSAILSYFAPQAARLLAAEQ